MATFSAKLDRLLERDHRGVGEKGRTIALLHGSRTARTVVLLHGMSAAPPQFTRFADELFARGHNVLVPRLPGHGHADRLSTALARLTAERLCAAADEYAAIGHELGERVTIGGFSLGGLLAAWIGMHHRVDRCISIAPFLGVSFVPGFVMTPAAELLLKLPNRFAWWNPVLREHQQPDHGYPRYATHAVGHAHRIARALLRASRTDEPLADYFVLVANASEATVSNRAIRQLDRSWRGAHELLVFGGLPPSHDVVEPLRRTDLAARVFPTLLRAIDPPSDTRTP